MAVAESRLDNQRSSSADGFWDSSITADLLLLFDAGTGISCVGGRLRDVGDGLEVVAGGGVL